MQHLRYIFVNTEFFKCILNFLNCTFSTILNSVLILHGDCSVDCHSVLKLTKFDKGLLLSFDDLNFLSLINHFKNCLQIISFKRRR